MRFSLSIECDNAASSTDLDDGNEGGRDAEIARILRALAERVENGSAYDGTPLCDANGNTVGYVRIEA